ncbi:MAG: hydrolase, partial [Bacteroidaceae bacterium]|nr:hydrolase [Bacteroidaceae bacterium]
MKAVTKRYLFIAVVFAVVITAICLQLPREKTVTIEFAIGKPWRHEQLTAPFDFAVAKSEAALERERAEVMASQRPYYAIEAQVGATAIDSFATFYKRELRHIVSSALQKRVAHRLESIYNNGIIGSNDLARLQGDSISAVMLIEQNRARPIPVSHLYTVQRAYDSLIAISNTPLERYVLQQSNLNDYITPNIHYDAAKSEAARRDALESISP